MISPSGVALKRSAVGGSGGGSRMMMLSLTVPFVAMTVIGKKTPPAVTLSVVASCPEPLVTPLATLKLPRALGSIVVKLRPTLAAG
jgi:hypothetical protein